MCAKGICSNLISVDAPCLMLSTGWTSASVIWFWTGRWPHCDLYTPVSTFQFVVVSTAQWPCWDIYSQHSVAFWTSRLRLCTKELTSLYKVTLSALEKLLMHVCAFNGSPCLADSSPAHLPRVSASNDEDDVGNQRRRWSSIWGGAHCGTPGDWGGSFEVTCWMVVY